MRILVTWSARQSEITSGSWFIESQRVGVRMCEFTSNVLHQDDPHIYPFILLGEEKQFLTKGHSYGQDSNPHSYKWQL